MKEKFNANTRDVARELARRYSTMTHEELDALESILVPIKYQKGELVLKEGDVCRNFYYIDRGLMRQFLLQAWQGSDRAFGSGPFYSDVY